MSDSQHFMKGQVAVIGAGTMGTGIAQISVMAGHTTYLYDTQASILENAGKNLSTTFKKLVDKGKISLVESENCLGRIHYINKLSEISSCTFVIEAIVEDLAIKQRLFVELESIVSASSILATNTSSLSVTSIAGACKNPERVLGVHFFNPAPLMPLVEIIPGLATDAATVQNVSNLILQWNKTVVHAKDTPGFIVNRVARSFYGESIRIYEEACYGLPEGPEGIATIDWAMKELGGFRMGPFELMDLIGNDVNYKVTETVWMQFYNDPRYKPSLTQKRMVEAGRLGKKTGQGYYNYAEGTTPVFPKKDPVLGNKILDRVLAMLINEAVDTLYLRVASATDIDLAMTTGVNYPKGLLKWCDELGAKIVLDTLSSLHSEYREERYRPSVLLKRLASNQDKIYS